METLSKVSGGSEPLIKKIVAAKRQSGHQNILNFSACKAQGNQHEIRIAFFEREKSPEISFRRLMVNVLWVNPTGKLREKRNF